ncbi:MAG TPA: pyridoxamine 5'-phosphate oxidase [Thermomicrobiales bacterium]|nr:pyridoxamine 5'-phosphate oxidase [Thermomicrobiales bacterium]
MVLHDMRRDYRQDDLSENEVDPDPFVLFRTWFGHVAEARGNEPNAMSIATADASGNPSVRTVLLKEVEPDGFVFFTNYESAKGTDLAANPRAELLFYWGELERQVRIHGSIEKVSREQSLEYFHSRPLGSQLGAMVSHQSTVIPSRDQLEAAYADLLTKYADKPVPLPDYWGGYRLQPQWFEFWQGRTSRLHDRLRYRLDQGAWVIERLAP